jgi:hypothetical protein
MNRIVSSKPSGYPQHFLTISQMLSAIKYSIAFSYRLLIQPPEKRNLCKLLVFHFQLEVESALKERREFSKVS